MTVLDDRESTPHTAEDILTEARRPGAAEPTEIRVRAAVLARLLREAVAAAEPPVVVDQQRGLGRLDGIPVVVDEDLPGFPGYEVHRDCIPGNGRSAA